MIEVDFGTLSSFYEIEAYIIKFIIENTDKLAKDCKIVGNSLSCDYLEDEIFVSFKLEDRINGKRVKMMKSWEFNTSVIIPYNDGVREVLLIYKIDKIRNLGKKVWRIVLKRTDEVII